GNLLALGSDSRPSAFSLDVIEGVSDRSMHRLLDGTSNSVRAKCPGDRDRFRSREAEVVSVLPGSKLVAAGLPVLNLVALRLGISHVPGWVGGVIPLAELG